MRQHNLLFISLIFFYLVLVVQIIIAKDDEGNVGDNKDNNNNSVKLLGICRLRGTNKHLPTLHGTFYFYETIENNNKQMLINGTLIGFNSYEFSNKKLPFHIHTYGNIVSNDGNQVGGHLLDSKGNDIGATLLPFQIEPHMDILKNKIITFQNYITKSSIFKMNEIIGRSLIIHHYLDNGKDRIGQCVIGKINNSLLIFNGELKDGLIAKLEGNNEFSQILNGMIYLNNDNKIIINLCGRLLDEDINNYEINIYENGDLSNLGNILKTIKLNNLIKNKYEDEILTIELESSLNNLLNTFVGSNIGLVYKKLNKIISIGILGIAQPNTLTNTNFKCNINIYSNDFKNNQYLSIRNYEKLPLSTNVKSKFFTNLIVENDIQSLTNKNDHFILYGYLLFDYVKKKAFVKLIDSSTKKEVKFIVIPNYFTRFLGVYIIGNNGKCSLISGQLHLSQIPLTLTLKEVNIENEININFKGFTLMNGIHCELWEMNTIKLFDREFKSTIQIYISRVNGHVVKLLISNTPVGLLSVDTLNTNDLNYPHDDELERETQLALEKCTKY
ncbi:hypothetical protein ABK040_009904 [Willaertia magna]